MNQVNYKTLLPVTVSQPLCLDRALFDTAEVTRTPFVTKKRPITLSARAGETPLFLTRESADKAAFLVSPLNATKCATALNGLVIMHAQNRAAAALQVGRLTAYGEEVANMVRAFEAKTSKQKYTPAEIEAVRLLAFRIERALDTGRTKLLADEGLVTVGEWVHYTKTLREISRRSVQDAARDPAATPMQIYTDLGKMVASIPETVARAVAARAEELSSAENIAKDGASYGRALALLQKASQIELTVLQKHPHLLQVIYLCLGVFEHLIGVRALHPHFALPPNWLDVGNGGHALAASAIITVLGAGLMLTPPVPEEFLGPRTREAFRQQAEKGRFFWKADLQMLRSNAIQSLLAAGMDMAKPFVTGYPAKVAITTAAAVGGAQFLVRQLLYGAAAGTQYLEQQAGELVPDDAYWGIPAFFWGAATYLPRLGGNVTADAMVEAADQLKYMEGTVADFVGRAGAGLFGECINIVALTGLTVVAFRTLTTFAAQATATSMQAAAALQSDEPINALIQRPEFLKLVRQGIYVGSLALTYGRIIHWSGSSRFYGDPQPYVTNMTIAQTVAIVGMMMSDSGAWVALFPSLRGASARMSSFVSNVLRLSLEVATGGVAAAGSLSFSAVTRSTVYVLANFAGILGGAKGAVGGVGELAALFFEGEENLPTGIVGLKAADAREQWKRYVRAATSFLLPSDETRVVAEAVAMTSTADLERFKEEIALPFMADLAVYVIMPKAEERLLRGNYAQHVRVQVDSLRAYMPAALLEDVYNAAMAVQFPAQDSPAAEVPDTVLRAAVLGLFSTALRARLASYYYENYYLQHTSHWRWMNNVLARNGKEQQLGVLSATRSLFVLALQSNVMHRVTDAVLRDFATASIMATTQIDWKYWSGALSGLSLVKESANAIYNGNPDLARAMVNLHLFLGVTGKISPAILSAVFVNALENPDAMWTFDPLQLAKSMGTAAVIHACGIAAMGIYDAFREYSDARDVLSETALGEPNEQFFKLISEGDLRRRVIGAATARPKPKRVVTESQQQQAKEEGRETRRKRLARTRAMYAAVFSALGLAGGALYLQGEPTAAGGEVSLHTVTPVVTRSPLALAATGAEYVVNATVHAIDAGVAAAEYIRKVNPAEYLRDLQWVGSSGPLDLDPNVLTARFYTLTAANRSRVAKTGEIIAPSKEMQVGLYPTMYQAEVFKMQTTSIMGSERFKTLPLWKQAAELTVAGSVYHTPAFVDAGTALVPVAPYNASDPLESAVAYISTSRWHALSFDSLEGLERIEDSAKSMVLTRKRGTVPRSPSDWFGLPMYTQPRFHYQIVAPFPQAYSASMHRHGGEFRQWLTNVGSLWEMLRAPLPPDASDPQLSTSQFMHPFNANTREIRVLENALVTRALADFIVDTDLTHARAVVHFMASSLRSAYVADAKTRFSEQSEMVEAMYNNIRSVPKARLRDFVHLLLNTAPDFVLRVERMSSDDMRKAMNSFHSANIIRAAPHLLSIPDDPIKVCSRAVYPAMVRAAKMWGLEHMPRLLAIDKEINPGLRAIIDFQNHLGIGDAQHAGLALWAEWRNGEEWMVVRDAKGHLRFTETLRDRMDEMIRGRYGDVDTQMQIDAIERIANNIAPLLRERASIVENMKRNLETLKDDESTAMGGTAIENQYQMERARLLGTKLIEVVGSAYIDVSGSLVVTDLPTFPRGQAPQVPEPIVDESGKAVGMPREESLFEPVAPVMADIQRIDFAGLQSANVVTGMAELSVAGVDGTVRAGECEPGIVGEHMVWLSDRLLSGALRPCFSGATQTYEPDTVWDLIVLPTRPMENLQLRGQPTGLKRCYLLLDKSSMLLSLYDEYVARLTTSGVFVDTADGDGRLLMDFAASLDEEYRITYEAQIHAVLRTERDEISRMGRMASTNVERLITAHTLLDRLYTRMRPPTGRVWSPLEVVVRDEPVTLYRHEVGNETGVFLVRESTYNATRYDEIVTETLAPPQDDSKPSSFYQKFIKGAAVMSLLGIASVMVTAVRQPRKVASAVAWAARKARAALGRSAKEEPDTPEPRNGGDVGAPLTAGGGIPVFAYEVYEALQASGRLPDEYGIVDEYGHVDYSLSGGIAQGGTEGKALSKPAIPHPRPLGSRVPMPRPTRAQFRAIHRRCIMDYDWRQASAAARVIAALGEPVTGAYAYATRLGDVGRKSLAAPTESADAFCFRVLVRRVYTLEAAKRIPDEFLRSIVLAVYEDYPIELVDPNSPSARALFVEWRTSAASVESAYVARRYAVPILSEQYEVIADFDLLSYIYEYGALGVAATVTMTALITNEI
jgi:hypothetical protein